MKIKITIYELDSKKQERITKCELFNSRSEAQVFLDKIKPEPMAYPIINSKPHYTMEGVLN